MTMEKGFSPIGLRVLVVDDDPTWLKILEKMLKKCSYEVTTCGLVREALNLLRERKDGYDIVISDVNMPDMDGFKLLEHVGLEMDLPVIMMSVDGETSRVMKGVQHGACDYLLKPIRMKELKIIWQHVLRKRLQDGYEGSDSVWITRYGFDHSDEGHLFSGEEVCFGKKRKELEKKHDERDSGDSSSTKKARVVWTFELHQKFVNAVNQIGCDHKAGPKKILDLMNVPWLTRENVASHLQKYRLYLSRLEKEDEQKCSSGRVKHVDSPLKDAEINSGHQSPRKIGPTGVPDSSYTFSGGNSLVQNANQNRVDVDLKGMASTPVSEPKITKLKKTQAGFDHSLSPLASGGNVDAFEPRLSPPYSWNDVPEVLESKPALFESSFLQQPLTSQSCYVAISEPSLTETEVKPSYENQCSAMERVAPVSEDEFLLAQGKSSKVNLQDFDVSAQSAISCLKPQEFNPSIPSSSDTDSILRSLNCELPQPHLGTSLDNDLQLHWLQGDCFFTNSGFQDIGFTSYSNQPLLTEYPFYFSDATRFANEHFPYPDEYSLVDQGLFIA